MTRTAVRLIIHGRVQGVGYRDWARSQALALRLVGWVRNRMDGTVELVAAGPPNAVARLEEACRSGPPAARVTSVEQAIAEDDGLSAFEMRRTV